MKTKKLSINFVGSALAIAPLTITAACAVNEQPSNIIDLVTISQNATFSVDEKLKQKFANEIIIKDLKWDQANQYQQVQVEFTNLKGNRELGLINFDAIFKDQNGEQVNRIANQITGFKTDQPIDGKALIDAEIARLKQLNQAQQLIKNTKVNQNDLIKWTQSPNLFLTNLNLDLNGQFNYIVSSFEYQNDDIEFVIIISYQNLSADLKLNAKLQIDTNVPIMPPNNGNLSIIETREQARLDHQWKLASNQMSIQHLDAINLQPNLILKDLDQFVFQQYFQYQIVELKIDRNDQNHQATISFKIQARFWKQKPPLKVLVSKKPLVFQIQTYDEKTSQSAPPKNPTNKSWKINAINNPLVLDFNQGAFDANKLFINKGGKIQIDEGAVKTLMKDMIADQKLVQIIGQLPQDWNWDLYLDFIINDDFKANQLPKTINLIVFVDYANSQDLDEVLDFNMELINLNLDENKIKSYDAQSIFDDFKTNFVKNIKPNVQLDFRKIVSIQDDPVNQFAMLDANNFLNYTNQDWNALIKIVNNGIRIGAKNVQINYLTNTISFQWNLSGRGEFANMEWTDNQISQLVLKTEMQINQTGFQFANNAHILNLNNFHQFNINNKMLDREQLREKLTKFSNNWTWMARELVTFAWFNLYQGFNNQFSQISISIIDHQGRPLPFNNLNQKYDDYKIVAKAKLDFGVNKSLTFLPFIQVFGSSLNLTNTTFKTGDEITIEIDLEHLLDRPDPVQDASEILPGLGQGITLGTGLGYQNVIEKWPPRFDIWQNQIGTYNFTIYQNQKQLGSQKNNHRFVSFNTMTLYDFQDQFWPEPNDENGKWVSGHFWN